MKIDAVQAQMFNGMSPHSWALVGWYVVVFVAFIVVCALIWRNSPPDDRRGS